MSRFVIAICAILVSACAGVQRHRDIPHSFSQTSEEQGKLTVGQVVSVEIKTFVESTDPALTAAVGAVGGALGAVAVLGLGGGDWYYRHTIRLKGRDEMVIRDEFSEYRVGSCVALRDKPYMVVPALPGACD